MSKRDDVKPLFNRVRNVSRYENWLFWGTPLLSFAGKLTTDEKTISVIVAVQIVITLFLVAIKWINENIFYYEAHLERSKSNIGNAFGIDMGVLKTEEYYNNNLQPSIGKYIVNCFESVYFSKTIAGKMIFHQAVKSIVSIIIFCVACFFSLKWDMLLIIAQLLLSSSLIIGMANIIIFARRCDKLFNDLYHDTITVGITSKSQLVMALSHVIEYEMLKSHYKINLSTKIYNKQNQSLSTEWNDIVSRTHVEGGNIEI